MKNDNLKLKTFTFLVVFFTFSFLAFTLAPQSVLAQPPLNQSMEEFRQITQYGEADLITAISRIVRIVLSFQGLILTLIIILAGFKWILSGGDEEKIKQAKSMIWNGIVGIAIVFLSWAIASFLITNLFQIVR